MRMALKRKQRKRKDMKAKQIHSSILSKIAFRYNDSKSELQAPAISERQICWFSRKGRNWSSKNLTNPYRTPHTSPRDQILQQSPERNEILKRPKTKRVAPPTCPFIRSPAHSTFRNEVEGIGKKIEHQNCILATRSQWSLGFQFGFATSNSSTAQGMQILVESS